MQADIKKNWAILLILLLALILRLPLLNGSFWLDEAAQALEIIRPTNQQLDLVKDFQPPLLHLILHFSFLIFNLKSEIFLRTIGALIPGLISIWATYKIGKKIINQKAGLLAALLLTTNSFHIFYSQELRPYSLPTAIAALSWLVLLTGHSEFISESKKSRFRIKSGMTAWVLVFFFLTSLGLYSSYLYPFLILSQIIYILFLNKKILKNFILALFFSALSFLPWLPMFLQQLKTGTSWQTQLPGWSSVVSIAQVKALPLVLGKFLYGIMNLEFNLIFLSVSVLILSLILVIAKPILLQFKNPKLFLKKHKNLIILLIWLLIPLIFTWLVSFIIPVLRPKRVLYLLPAFYLVISYLLSYSKKSVLIKLVIALLLLTNIISSFNYFTKPKYQREDWRKLHQQIYDKFDIQNTLLIFSFDEPFAPWLWYEKNSKFKIQNQKFNTLSTGKLYISDVENLKQKLEIAKNYKTLLVFDYLRDLTDPDDRLLVSLKNQGFREIGAIEAKQTGFVRIYTNSN